MPVSEPAAWSLECSGCGATRDAAGLPGVCDCGQPYLVRYRSTPPPEAKALLPGRGWTMWRYREWLPLADAEAPITLGEGGTPLLTVPRLAAKHGLRGLFVKEEGANPTGSFKARGLAAAVNRAALAEQLGWTLPDAIVYPTGGGTGLIGMWKAFQELMRAGWLEGTPPRLYSVQAAGCAPVVKGFEAGAESCAPWPNPQTIAAGLRVPAPLGDRLMLRALRESGGGAVAVTDGLLAAAARDLQTLEGIDASPEGGASLAGAIELKARGAFHPDDRVVIFNTGARWLYRA